MADEQQLEMLRRSVEEWNSWRDEDSNVHIDLSKAELRGKNLSNANLSEANLSEANLSEADLSEADLTKTNLTRANLSEANLIEANLTEANLSEANLIESRLIEAYLSRAHLNGAHLNGAHLSEAHLSAAHLSAAHLRRADLYRADLRVADLSKADLSKAHLHGANLHGANLREADLIEARLTEANLSRANLDGANLSRANLDGANLSKADLSDVYLTSADLSNADLSDADLRGANLNRTYLVSADLKRADLRQTVLRGANLRRADLNQIRYGRTILVEIDFSNVSGLESGQHERPSTIDFATLYLSQGKIPDIFLRGCGMPENMITYLPALLERAIQFYSCFISYSHDDKEFAQRLHDRLQGEGIRCWLDEHQLNPGDPLHSTIYEAIRVYDKVLLCCSETSLNSWWVEKEFSRATTKEEDYRLSLIVPLNVDGFLFKRECDGWIADDLKQRVVADFTNWKDHDAFENAVKAVIKALRTDGGNLPHPEPKLKRNQ